MSSSTSSPCFQAAKKQGFQHYAVILFLVICVFLHQQIIANEATAFDIVFAIYRVAGWQLMLIFGIIFVGKLANAKEKQLTTSLQQVLQLERRLRDADEKVEQLTRAAESATQQAQPQQAKETNKTAMSSKETPDHHDGMEALVKDNQMLRLELEESKKEKIALLADMRIKTRPMGLMFAEQMDPQVAQLQTQLIMANSHNQTLRTERDQLRREVRLVAVYGTPSEAVAATTDDITTLHRYAKSLRLQIELLQKELPELEQKLRDETAQAEQLRLDYAEVTKTSSQQADVIQRINHKLALHNKLSSKQAKEIFELNEELRKQQRYLQNPEKIAETTATIETPWKQLCHRIVEKYLESTWPASPQVDNVEELVKERTDRLTADAQKSKKAQQQLTTRIKRFQDKENDCEASKEALTRERQAYDDKQREVHALDTYLVQKLKVRYKIMDNGFGGRYVEIAE